MYKNNYFGYHNSLCAISILIAINKEILWAFLATNTNKDLIWKPNKKYYIMDPFYRFICVVSFVSCQITNKGKVDVFIPCWLTVIFRLFSSFLLPPRLREPSVARALHTVPRATHCHAYTRTHPRALTHSLAISPTGIGNLRIDIWVLISYKPCHLDCLSGWTIWKFCK